MIHTAAAASRTETFARRSLREHSQTDRMLMSSARWRQSKAKQIPFTANARAPTTPIVSKVGKLRIHELVYDLSEDERAEQPHHGGLRHGGSRLPHCTACDNVETETVYERIAQHVEGVGEKRYGPRDKTGNELDEEHHGVSRQHQAQGGCLTLAQPFYGTGFIDAAIVHRLNHAQPFDMSGVWYRA